MMGPGTASWRPLFGKHAAVFGMENEDSMGTLNGMNNGPSMMLSSDLNEANSALQGAIITGATVLQCYNNFPVPLGVNVNCLPKREVSLLVVYFLHTLFFH